MWLMVLMVMVLMINVMVFSGKNYHVFDSFEVESMSHVKKFSNVCFNVEIERM